MNGARCARGSARSTAKRCHTASQSTSARRVSASGSLPRAHVGPILATLVEVLSEQRCDSRGVVDDTQVDEVFHQWRTNGVSEWKIPLLRRILDRRDSAGRRRSWTPDSVHDFMHAKVVVADDTTFVGSFNFSRSGERNAENVLEIRDAAVADRLATMWTRSARVTREPRFPTRDGEVEGNRRDAATIARPYRMLTTASQIAQGNETTRCLTSLDTFGLQGGLT